MAFLHSTRYILLANRRGIATLPALLGLIILIVAVVIGISAIGMSDAIISLGQTQSTKALGFAQAGAKDALQRLARDYTFTSSSYSIDFATSGCSLETACATISISTGTGATGDPKIIISTGRYNQNIRSVEVDVLYDANMYGEIATTTWREI